MTTQFVQDSMSIIHARVRNDKGEVFHMDSGESMFLERQLESVESRLYEKKLRLLKYRQLLPVSNRDNPGAQNVTYYMYTKVGMAKIISNPADDLPRADVFAKRFTANVHSIGTSFGYSTQDLRAAMMNNTPLDSMKAASAQRAIREEENQLAWFGDSNYGLPGFLTNANIPNVQAPLNAGLTSRTWLLKTPDEIIADVSSMVAGIRSNTKGVHQGNVLLLPIDQYTHISTTPRSANTDTTILEFIMKPNNAFGITKIDWLNELVGAGTGATDMAVLYELDDEVVEVRIPMEMTMLPPQMDGLMFDIPVEARNGGVVVRYPLACTFLYGI